MRTINFTSNFNNKLDCQCFITIRSDYYNDIKVGSICQIALNKNVLYNAQLLAVKPFKLGSLNEFVSCLDTGYSVAETIAMIRKMYNNKITLNDTMYLLLFARVPSESQAL